MGPTPPPPSNTTSLLDLSKIFQKKDLLGLIGLNNEFEPSEVIEPTNNLNYNVILATFIELALKSDKVRARYTRYLVKNIGIKLENSHIKYKDIKNDRARIYIYPELEDYNDYNNTFGYHPELDKNDIKEHNDIKEDNDIKKDNEKIRRNKYLNNLLDNILKVIGVYSVSPAVETYADMENITKTTLEYTKQIFKKGNTFGVRAKVGNNKDFSASKLERYLGEMILNNTPKDLNIKVNLSEPTYWIFLEIRSKQAYIYHKKIFSNWT
ncbi:MAG: THUMP domain-containing protein, partial [Promethearchaeota archaeon]